MSVVNTRHTHRMWENIVSNKVGLAARQVEKRLFSLQPFLINNSAFLNFCFVFWCLCLFHTYTVSFMIYIRQYQTLTIWFFVFVLVLTPSRTKKFHYNETIPTYCWFLWTVKPPSRESELLALECYEPGTPGSPIVPYIADRLNISIVQTHYISDTVQLSLTWCNPKWSFRRHVYPYWCNEQDGANVEVTKVGP